MSKKTIHGIDLTAPGGLEALFAYRRAQFGDATMSIAPGEAAPAPAGAPAEPAAPAVTPATVAPVVAPVEPAVENVADLPAWAQKIIADTRKEAGDSRAAGKTAAETAQAELVQRLGQALGLVKDGEPAPDPAALTAQLSEQQATARDAQIQLAIFRAAPKSGADADALLDSNSFLSSIREVDPADAKAIGDAIAKAVADNPKLRTVLAAGASGANFTGGSGEGAQKPTTIADAVAARYR